MEIRKVTDVVEIERSFRIFAIDNVDLKTEDETRSDVRQFRLKTPKEIFREERQHHLPE